MLCPPDCAHLPAKQERDPKRALFDRLQAELIEFTFDLEKRRDRRGLEAFLGRTHRTYEAWEQAPTVIYLVYGHTDARGERAVEVFLRERAAGRSEEELAILRACAAAAPSLVEIQDVRRDEGLALRDLVSGERRFVHERALTSQVLPGQIAMVWEMHLAGRDELLGVELIPPAHVRVVRRAFEAAQAREAGRDPASTREQRARRAVAEAHRELREAVRTWVPRARDADGAEVAPCGAVYGVHDVAGALARLSSHPDLVPTSPGGFAWLAPPEAPSPRAQPDDDVPTFSSVLADPSSGAARRVVGTLELRTVRLSLTCHTRERLAEGKRLLQGLLGHLLTHRYDKEHDLAELVPHGPRGEDHHAPLELELGSDPQVPVAEALSRWLAENPAEAARFEALAETQQAGRRRALEGPAPDATPGARPAAPDRRELVPLPHEQLGVLVPGLDRAIDELARAERRRPGWEARTISHEQLKRCAALQEALAGHARRLIRDEHWSEEAAVEDANMVGAYAHFAVNHELHHRKTFWAESTLAWALHETTLEVPGACLKLPFSSAAFVFADPLTLELADSLLSHEGPARARRVKRLTVYVVEGERREAELDLRLAFLFDREARSDDDDDWPYLLARDLVVRDEDRLDQILESHPGDGETSRATVFRAPEMKKLVHLVVNALLYATSAHPEPLRLPNAKPGQGPGRRRAKRGAGGGRASSRTYTDDDVFFLPGTIDITSVKRFQELERHESGRTVLRRFLVRGHWRRAAAGWSDPRLRWIEPYWKGPDLGMIIERAYRLKP